MVVGVILSLVAVVGGKGGLNGFLLLFYGLVLGIQLYSSVKRKAAWGVVVNDAGKPVKGVQLDLVDPRFEKLVQRRVTDEDGKYQFIVPEGKYVIRIGSVEYNLLPGKAKTYQGQDIEVVGEKPRLIALKIVVSPVKKG
jgi:hypothetical protein